MTVDTLFSHARIFNPYTRNWSVTDIAVLNGKIFYVGDCTVAGIETKEQIECAGATVIPGMIDIHLHIESSLCTPHTFSEAVLPCGVTTVVAEHHEMANIFGRKGIEQMIAASRMTALDIFHGIPSSVPSTNAALETTGGTIDATDLPLLTGADNPDVICLGEVMNFSTLISEFEQLVTHPHAVKSSGMIAYLKEHHPLMAIEGHCPSIRGIDLAKLLYLGVDSDHCQQDLTGMAQRFANGMFVEIQEKSVTGEVVEYLQSHDVDTLWAFVTDDVPPDLLVEKGHLDHVVRKALAYGLSLEKAIIATSHAPAMRMGMRDRGALVPGKIADLIMLEGDPSLFSIGRVFKRGRPVESLVNSQEPYRFAPFCTESLALDGQTDFSPLFSIASEADATVRVMRKSAESTYTEEVHLDLRAEAGTLQWREAETPLNLVTVMNRYRKNLHFSQAFLSGDCLEGGAYCTTYAHDHHNILLLGDNEQDMRIALQWVLSHGGGICVAAGGTVAASVELPIGGILSELPMPELGACIASIQTHLHKLGMRHHNPLMSLSTITLPVSPALKVTDRGLVDVASASLVPLFI